MTVPDTLGQLIRDIAPIPDNLIVYVPETLTALDAASPIELHRLEEAAAGLPGLRYLLEVELVRDALEAWSLWRDGRVPSLDEAVAAVVHYAEYDAYLPAE